MMNRRAPSTNFLDVGTLGQMVWAIAFVNSLRTDLKTDDESAGEDLAGLTADIAVSRLRRALGNWRESEE